MSIYQQHLCQVYWGSHGCHLPRGHEGDHHCDEECNGGGVGRDGRDASGFQWYLYGDDAPFDETDDEGSGFTVTFTAVGPIHRNDEGPPPPRP